MIWKISKIEFFSIELFFETKNFFCLFDELNMHQRCYLINKRISKSKHILSKNRKSASKSCTNICDVGWKN